MYDVISDRPYRALRFVNYGHFLNHIIMLIYPTVALTLSDSWENSYGELLSAFFVGSMIYGFAAYPAGWLSDRWSSWWLLGIYFIGTGIATMAAGFTENLTQMMICLSVVGLFASIYHPVGTAFVVKYAVNRAQDLGRNGAWGTAGLAFAAFIAAALTYLFNWRAAFFIPGGVCLLLGVAFFATTRPAFHSTKKGQIGVKSSEVKLLTPALIRVLSIMSLTILSVGLFTQAFTSGLPNLYDNTLRDLVAFFSFDVSQGRTLTAAFVSLVILFGSVGQLIGGNLSSRWSPRLVYMGMFLFILPLTFLSINLDGMALVGVGALMMIAVTGALPAENCILVYFAPEDWHARIFSLKFVIGLGGGSASLLANGYIFDRSQDFSWFFGFLSLLAITIIIGSFFLPHVRVHRENLTISQAKTKLFRDVD